MHAHQALPPRLALLGAALLSTQALPEAQTATPLGDLHPGPASSFSDFFADGFGTLYFKANNGVTNLLWRSDGTAAGTVPVTGAAPFNPTGFTVSGATVFFNATQTGAALSPGLWKTDGTPAGTVAVGAPGGDPKQMTSFNGRLYFQGNGPGGRELWMSDGTAAGTIQVKDIFPGPGSSVPVELTVCGGKLFFAAQTPAEGYELWVSDGTSAGTTLVADLFPGLQTGGLRPFFLTSYRDRLYFNLDDGNDGAELWTSDGTLAGTFQVKDIRPGSAGSSPQFLTVSGDRLFFSAFDDPTNGIELWSSDGTAANTQMVLDLTPGGSTIPMELTDVNGVLFFAGRELYRSDGSAVGTFQVADINPGAPASFPTHLAAVGNRVYFSANNGTAPAGDGRELWSSDGTVAGTVLVADLFPGSGFDSSSPSGMTLACGRLFFAADDGVSGREPFVVQTPGASARPFGDSPAPHSPTLESTPPILGGSMTFSGTGPIGYQGVLLLTLPTTMPSVLSGGSFGYVDPTARLLPTQLLVPGDWTFDLAIPNLVGLNGLCAAAQVGWVQPGELVTSNGLLLGLGN